MSIEAIKKALEGVTPGPWELCAHLKHNDACSCGYRGVIYGPELEGFAICQPGHEPAPEGQEGTEPPRYSRDVEIANMKYIAAANPAAITALISEIDRLQRENAALREDRYKLACAIIGGEDAPGLLDSTPTSEIVEIAQHAHRMHQDDIARAMAAELEVERLQTELALSKPLYSRRQIEARVKLLEEALKPFAEEAENWSDSVPDDHKTLCTEPGSSTAHPGSEAYFTVGDLRRARTTLASTGGEHHAE